MINTQSLDAAISKKIKRWLLASAFSILIIVIVGGMTRLTDSGLSMVDWNPIMGSIPPLNHAQWQASFDAYKQFPEYQKINISMTLSEFKKIFFWEYLHRMIGRFIGLIIMIPYLYFLYKRWLTPYLKKRGFIMIILVIAQGVMGWYMVKSGLVNNPDVSHFRLSAHLLLAFFLFQYILWTLYQLIFPSKKTQKISKKVTYSKPYYFSLFLTILVGVQIMFGAFVSGLDAGYGYNTFPKMGDEWLPQSAFLLNSLWDNILHNRVMIQFVHRSFAWALVFLTLIFAFYSKKTDLSEWQKKAFNSFLFALLIQFFLGVLTLVFVIPLPLALLHQLGGLVLLSSSCFLLFVWRYSI